MTHTVHPNIYILFLSFFLIIYLVLLFMVIFFIFFSVFCFVFLYFLLLFKIEIFFHMKIQKDPTTSKPQFSFKYCRILTLPGEDSSTRKFRLDLSNIFSFQLISHEILSLFSPLNFLFQLIFIEEPQRNKNKQFS